MKFISRAVAMQAFGTLPVCMAEIEFMPSAVRFLYRGEDGSAELLLWDAASCALFRWDYRQRKYEKTRRREERNDRR